MNFKINLKKAITELIAAGKGIEDTGKYDEHRETAIRDMATKVGAYAESGQTYDPAGKYLCGGCCFRDGESACTLVTGAISMTTGSCMIYLRGGPVDLKVAQKFTQQEVSYSERPDAKGFGCSRCKFGSEAKKPADGRESWCSFWGMHIQSKACCMAETGKDLIEAPGA